MDGNATCHRTLAVQDCLDSEGIQRLVWPVRSPDLNPIENVYRMLWEASCCFRTMDKPTISSMTNEHSCIIWEKLGSSSENNSDLGDIIKIRGVTTLRTASSEQQDGLLPRIQTDVVYTHKSCCKNI
ncbi:hypothetical protein TNCV_3345841 [Trichonephila clavipes]|nr:hypothetical protein TNCV_3345841 [Trichonephila clavipes]